jgi:hypothetical protein
MIDVQPLISGQREIEEEGRDGEGVRTSQMIIDNGDGKIGKVQGTTEDNADRRKNDGGTARNPQKETRGDNDGKEIVQDRKKGEAIVPDLYHAQMREARGEFTIPARVQDLGHGQNREDRQSSERRQEANVRGRKRE